MSADNLWLIRERDGKFYPTMEFASDLVQGFIPDEPKPGVSLSFDSWQLAEEYCDDQDRNDEMGMGGTEYGIFSEDTLDELYGMKAADQAIAGDFAKKVIEELEK